MKRILVVIFFSLVIQLNIHAQDAVNSIKIYSVEWNLKSKIPYTIDNFKNYYKYYFETKENDLENMFLDYNDCVEKLTSQKELILSDSIKTIKINTLVELTFGKNKKVELFFDYKGNFYFQNKWHARNDGLYYILFKYFSNVIISQPSIEEAKQNVKDDLWHE